MTLCSDHFFQVCQAWITPSNLVCETQRTVHTNGFAAQNIEDAGLRLAARPAGFQLQLMSAFIHHVHNLAQSLFAQSLHD